MSEHRRPPSRRVHCLHGFSVFPKYESRRILEEPAPILGIATCMTGLVPMVFFVYAAISVNTYLTKIEYRSVRTFTDRDVTPMTILCQARTCAVYSPHPSTSRAACTWEGTTLLQRNDTLTIPLCHSRDLGNTISLVVADDQTQLPFDLIGFEYIEETSVHAQSQSTRYDITTAYTSGSRLDVSFTETRRMNTIEGTEFILWERQPSDGLILPMTQPSLCATILNATCTQCTCGEYTLRASSYRTTLTEGRAMSWLDVLAINGGFAGLVTMVFGGAVNVARSTIDMGLWSWWPPRCGRDRREWEHTQLRLQT